MARKRKNASLKKQNLHRKILAHACVLNISTVADYQQWCRENGYSSSLNKTSNQKWAEIQTHRKVQFDRQLKKHNKEKNLRYKIQSIYAGDLKLKDIENEVLKHIYRGVKVRKRSEVLRKYLLFLESTSKLLTRSETTRACVALAQKQHLWVRDFSDWKPTTHNVERQLSSLARHLFAVYDVPTFMDQAWLSGSRIQQSWFVHIGAGGNIRRAQKLPVPLTKKMAHFFIESPAGYSINAAFRYSQIKSLGGSLKLLDAINGTRLIHDFTDNEFWLSVIRFFIDNPMLDYAHVNPIVDYIWNEKYTPRIEFIARGEAREIAPAQPNFTMRGRTPATLLRNVQAWHRQLNAEAKGGNLQWQRSRYNDFEFVEGDDFERNMKTWRIRELLSSKELHAEGRQQKHCVASYAHSCAKGNSSIWTMDLHNREGIKKHLTIEIDLRHKRVCQIRGKENRMATVSEMKVIRRWAQNEGISVTNY